MSADRAWKGMSRLKKETIASRIRSWASSRRIFFALHWNSVDAFGAQRSKWKSKGIHAELVKVRVARKGIENTRCSFLKDALRGPTALVHADTDERYAHKAFNDIVKPLNDKDLIYVSGAIDGVCINRDEMKLMKDAPEPTESIAAVLQQFSMYQIAPTLQSPTQQLVSALEGRLKQLEEQTTADNAGSAPAESLQS